MSNVDNTSDANKPVSTAQQAALDSKANKALPNITAPTLLNNWIDYGGGFHACGYYKDEFGIVHLTGIVKSGTAASVIFALPVGFRPLADAQFAVAASGGSARMDARQTRRHGPASTGSATPCALEGSPARMG